MERSRKKIRGHRETRSQSKIVKESETARLTPEKEKNKTAAQAYTATKMRQRDIKRL